MPYKGNENLWNPKEQSIKLVAKEVENYFKFAGQLKKLKQGSDNDKLKENCQDILNETSFFNFYIQDRIGNKELPDDPINLADIVYQQLDSDLSDEIKSLWSGKTEKINKKTTALVVKLTSGRKKKKVA